MKSPPDGTSRPRRRRYSNLHYVRAITQQVWHHPSNRDRRVRAVANAYTWQVSKRLIRRPRLRSFGPYRIRCHPDTGSATNVIYFTERFDPDEQSFMEAYLRPGDAVVDAGANVGLYTLWAAGLTAPDGRVDAFEAAPHTVVRLRENIALNDLGARVTVHPVAVGAAPGVIAFTVDADVSNTVAVNGAGERATVDVPVVALDDRLDAGRYTLGKVDVEGFEIETLQGWSRRLSVGDPPVLLIEAIPGQLARHDHTVGDLTDTLDRLGFELHGYDAVRGTLEPLDADGDGVGKNLFAVHRDHRAAVLDRLGERH